MDMLKKIVLKNGEQVIFASSDNYDAIKESDFHQQACLSCIDHCFVHDLFDCVCAIEENSMTYEELLERLELESSDISFEDLRMTLLYSIYETRIHKCWDECKNAYPSKCEKVLDLPKDFIEDYPFIRQGFQVLGDEEIERFIVVNCEHYEYLDDHKGKPMSRRR